MRRVLFLFLLAFMFTNVDPASAQSPSGAPGAPAEVDAIKDVLQQLASAFNERNLDLLLSFWAEDARIDSRSAGGKVAKPQYAEAMKRLLASGRANRTHYGDLKVALQDDTHAVVDGGQYNWDPKTGQQRLGSRYQWRLEKREGKWLIVDGAYK